MDLKPIGPNQTEVKTRGGVRVLYSYKTPVAAWLPEVTVRCGVPDGCCERGGIEVGPGYVKTNRFFSKTTSRHINAWLHGEPAMVVPQAFLEGLV